MISPDHVALLERCYILHPREPVLSFLERHPHLVPLILEGFGAIRHAFKGV